MSDTQAVPAPAPIPDYTPPVDIPAKISELPDNRQGPPKALLKAITAAIGSYEKKNGPVAADGVPADVRAERFALQIERAVHDTHATHKEYATQIRTLNFNLKKNPELYDRLLRGLLTPTMLASMNSDDLASDEMRARWPR